MRRTAEQLSQVKSWLLHQKGHIRRLVHIGMGPKGILDYLRIDEDLSEDFPIKSSDISLFIKKNKEYMYSSGAYDDY